MITEGNTAVESAYQQVLKQIEANPDTDKDSLNQLAQLHGALAKDILGTVEAKSKESEAHIARANFAQEALKTLKSEIAKLVDEDDEDLAADVEALAIRDFENKEEYKEAREKFQKGELDKKAIQSLAKKTHERLSKSEKKKPNLSGMESQASTDLAKQAGDKAINKSELNPQQKSLFNAKVEQYLKCPDLYKRKHGYENRGQAEQAFLREVSKKFV